MADKKISVFGIYPSLTQAERGVDALVHGRFSHDDISVLAPDQQGTKDFAHEKHTKAPEGARRCGGRRSARATLGLVPASARSPFPVSGPSLRRAQSWVLAGLGVGGAVGGLVGALVGMGVPEHEAKRYEGRVKDGGVLLSVHCATADEVTRAKKILEQTSAEDISSSGEKTGETYARFRRTAGCSTSSAVQASHACAAGCGLLLTPPARRHRSLMNKMIPIPRQCPAGRRGPSVAAGDSPARYRKSPMAG